MNGILVINKPKGFTSRDVVNKVSRLINTKKIGHTGTLDPIATGVLVLCIGSATKIVELLTNDEKEYIASIKLGIKTDTLDITGNIIDTKNNINITKEHLEEVLKSFIGKYNQEVPLFSAVKVRGKRLYQYARNNKEVILPKREVEIKELSLLEYTCDTFKIKCLVSKGTYIRSLIRDIGDRLGTYATMSDLVRTKQGIFTLEDSYTLEDIENNNYKTLSIEEALKSFPSIIVDKNMEQDILNGKILDDEYDENVVVFINKNNKAIAIYKKYEKEKGKIKPKKVFNRK